MAAWTHPRTFRLKFPEPSATPSVLRVRPASPPPQGPEGQAALALEPRELWVAAHVPRVLPRRINPLPLAVLRGPAEHNARLAAMGVCTLGELMRLPRAGFAKRFGASLLADLDRLLGRPADP